jgi:hypothetical protein
MFNWNEILTSVAAVCIVGAIGFIFTSVISMQLKLKKIQYDLNSAFDKIRQYHPEEQRNGGSRKRDQK